jgi:hypothetical protein
MYGVLGELSVEYLAIDIKLMENRWEDVVKEVARHFGDLVSSPMYARA